MRIGVLGTGSVGMALGKGLVREGHKVAFGSRNPAKSADVVYALGKDVACVTLADAVDHGEVVVFAVPWRGSNDTVKAVGAPRFKGKVVVDAMNALNEQYELAIGHHTSGAEELQKALPGAHVVKAFNSVFADNMPLGRIGATKLAALVAADDAKAKQTVLQLAEQLGFDPVDAGPLKSARYLEAMALQVITLGYGLKMGTGIGFALARKK